MHPVRSQSISKPLTGKKDETTPELPNWAHNEKGYLVKEIHLSKVITTKSKVSRRKSQARRNYMTKSKANIDASVRAIGIFSRRNGMASERETGSKGYRYEITIYNHMVYLSWVHGTRLLWRILPPRGFGGNPASNVKK